MYSEKEQKMTTLFKNINLNKLTKKELVLLLHLVEHYQKDVAENQSEELTQQLDSYGDLICEHIQKTSLNYCWSKS